MEKIEKRSNVEIKRLLNTAMLAIAGLLTTTLIALPQKSFSQTTNNKNNLSLSTKKISVSDYQKMLEQRDKNIQNQLDRWESKESITEYLERTQKEMFLSSYKSNKNMVKYNIDKIGNILKNKYGYTGLKDPIEILNTAITELAKSSKINGLNNYSDKINVEDFDINTINSIGFIEAWEEGGKDMTYNSSANGVLGIIIKNLETTKTIEHYNQEVKKQEPIKKNEQEPIKKDIEIIEKNKQEKVIETDGENMEERVKKVDGGYPVIIPSKNKETGDEIDISVEEVENIVDTTNIENSTLEESMDMFVDYNFQKNLAQGLPIQTQKNNIQQLMDESEILKKFVKELEEIGIYFENGDSTNVNRISAILRIINGDLKHGQAAINKAKKENLEGGAAVAFITIQNFLNNDDNKENKSIEQQEQNEQGKNENEVPKTDGGYRVFPINGKK